MNEMTTDELYEEIENLHVKIKGLANTMRDVRSELSSVNPDHSWCIDQICDALFDHVRNTE